MNNTSKYFEAQILWKDELMSKDPETVLFKLGGYESSDEISQEDDKIFYYLQSESELETLKGEAESIEDFYIVSIKEVSNPFITLREKLIQSFELMLNNKTVRLTANTASELEQDINTTYIITAIHSNEELDLYNEENDIFITVGILGILI